MNAPRVTLRPIGPGDEPFLRRVYASTRQDELAPLGWGEAQIDLFLRQQFDAQRRHYQTHYGDADFSVILFGEQPIGRLYVARRPEQILLIDIALLPAHRGAGIGSALIRALLDESERTGVPVGIHVEKLNRALRLYRRLGFMPVADRGVYWFLEYVPGHADGAVAVGGASRGEWGGT